MKRNGVGKLSFAHLQIATAFSLLSSTVSIPSLVQRAKQLHIPALAMTDRNVLHGVLPFYKACSQAGIKPIIGLTVDLFEESEEKVYPLILLAKNNIGYKNLLKISSVINIDPNRVLLWKWLQAYKEGLIAITPGEEGMIEQYVRAGKIEEAQEVVDRFRKLFGSDCFYLSLQNDGREERKERVKELAQFAKQISLPLVATNNVHYVNKEDHFAYRCLLAIRDGEKMSDQSGAVVDQQEQYLKTPDEMKELFQSYPTAIKNTLKIAEQCNVFIETNKNLLPKYPLKKNENAKNVLRRLCEEGLKKRNIDQQNYQERLHYELTVIDQMGFNDYFLIVWDFMKYARDQGIITGPGRGSAAGSLVAYSLQITNVDPIKHGLLFERFLNPERVSMPDIDIDFPDHRRDEVIEYVAKKYGKMHVAQIITFGTFATRAALRDTARAFGLPQQEIDTLAKMVPSSPGMTLKKAVEQSSAFRQFISSSERNRMLYETALKIEGLPRHTSTHAAGVVISEQPLVQLVPIQGGHHGIYLTQLPMEDLEEIGLLKMDFLGLRNLSLLERIIKSIEIHTGRKIHLDDIPFHDEQTYTLLQKGDTTGVFQLESEGMRRVLRQLKPTSFEDIVAVNALFRPGPMENIPVYIARKHGKQRVQYLHPDLKQILDFTYGVIVYQEQIMQISSTLARFTLGEADLLRRAVSKKNKHVLDQERKRFVSGAITNGYDERIANQIYDLIVRFANYGFNRSHAVAYSVVSWQLAWLKAHFPQYFLAALLTSVIGNEEKIALYSAEAKQKGINILSPSINKSHYPFLVEEQNIRFSLGAIKGLGAVALKEIIEARKEKPFTDLFDFCVRVSPRLINRKVLESLVLSGSFDEFGKDRSVLLATLDVALEHAELMKPKEASGDLFIDEEMFQFQPRYVEVEAMSLADQLAFEKEVTGIYLSDHPVSTYSKLFQQIGVKELWQLEKGERNVVVGVYMNHVKPIRTKKGDAMAFLRVSDATSEMEAVVFPDVYRKYSSLCKQEEIVLMTGHIEERNGKLQLIVKQMERAIDVKVNKKERGTLYLKIPKQIHHLNTLSLVQQILRNYPGETCVILHYEKNNQTLKLSRKNWVHPSSECLRQLKKLLGKSSVILK